MSNSYRWFYFARLARLLVRRSSQHLAPINKDTKMKALVVATLCLAALATLPPCHAGQQEDYNDVLAMFSVPLPENSLYTPVGYECTINKYVHNFNDFQLVLHFIYRMSFFFLNVLIYTYYISEEIKYVKLKQF